MSTLKFFLLRLTSLLLIWCGLYFLANNHSISYTTQIGLSAIILVIFIAIPRPMTKVEYRQYLVKQAAVGFKQICQRIVDVQYQPIGAFDSEKLRQALGIKRLPKPEYVSKFESENVYTFQIKENFVMKVSIVSGMMNTGGGMSYQTFEFSGYEFGNCKLYEGETECATFNYKHRFIHWKTEEFEDATGFVGKSEYLENYLDVEDRRVSALVKRALAEG